MKTKKDFIENYCTCPELAKKVFNQLGVPWSEIKERPEDFRDAGAGVSGFIYYYDTVPFAKKNLIHITMALNEFESEIGEPLSKDYGDETGFFNWYAWFALEHVIDQVMTYMDY